MELVAWPSTKGCEVIQRIRHRTKPGAHAGIGTARSPRLYKELGAVPRLRRADIDDLNIYAMGVIDMALRELTDQPMECVRSLN